jgi:hypothetical protein
LEKLTAAYLDHEYQYQLVIDKQNAWITRSERVLADLAAAFERSRGETSAAGAALSEKVGALEAEAEAFREVRRQVDSLSAREAESGVLIDVLSQALTAFEEAGNARMETLSQALTASEEAGNARADAISQALMASEEVGNARMDVLSQALTASEEAGNARMDEILLRLEALTLAQSGHGKSVKLLEQRVLLFEQTAEAVRTGGGESSVRQSV